MNRRYVANRRYAHDAPTDLWYVNDTTDWAVVTPTDLGMLDALVIAERMNREVERESEGVEA